MGSWFLNLQSAITSPCTGEGRVHDEIDAYERMVVV